VSEGEGAEGWPSDYATSKGQAQTQAQIRASAAEQAARDAARDSAQAGQHSETIAALESIGERISEGFEGMQGEGDDPPSGDCDPATEDCGDEPPSGDCDPAIEECGETEEWCADHPDSIACFEAGDFGEAPEIPEREIELSWASERTSAGSCPAPQTVTYMGQELTFSWAPICTAASMLRWVIIAVNTLLAGSFVVGALRYK